MSQRSSASRDRISRWRKSLLGIPEGIKTVLREEREWVAKRRRAVEAKAKGHQVAISSDDPARSAVGLAFSGGGIRSATFNLGLLQAFERYKLLWHVDYLSTVSGGGYIGSSLTWFKALAAKRQGSADPDDTFPFGTERKHHADVGGKVLAWLRAYGSYLSPGSGLTVWSLIAAVLTGTLVNLLILVPPFMLLFDMLAWRPRTLPGFLESLHAWLAPQPAGAAFVVLLLLGAAVFLGALVLLGVAWVLGPAPEPTGKNRLLIWAGRAVTLGVSFAAVGASPRFVPGLLPFFEAGAPLGNLGLGFALSVLIAAAALAAFAVMVTVYVVSTTTPKLRRFTVQRRLRAWAGLVLMYAALFAAVGTIPLVYDFVAARLQGWVEQAMSGVSVAGLLAMLTAGRGRKEGNETRGWRSLLLSVGLALFCYGLLLWFHHLSGTGFEAINSPWPWAAVGVSLLLAFFANINHVSMHRYYRNRLMEAYMPAGIPGAAGRSEEPRWYPYATPDEADEFRLSAIPPSDAPYHLINTNLQTVGSENPKLRRRGGDSFIFSPLYCGAESTGYASTVTYLDGRMNLATAFAISGAAVDPNTFATRSRPLAFLMTLVNARLGFWIPNPRYPTMAKRAAYALAPRPWWYVYMFSEMLGRGLNETHAQVHLSDGGHFENLALYELIRRRCRYIIVSDAGADPSFAFADLSKVIEMARVDFGAEIEIEVHALRPDDDTKRSGHAFARGTITYHDTGTGEAQKADLLYIKTTVIDRLTEDIYGYQRAHDSFPDESTTDQFFSEPQFEAYRELGFLIGRLACQDADVSSMDAFFRAVDGYLHGTSGEAGAP